MLTFRRVTDDVLVVDVHLQLAVALLSGVLCSQQRSLVFSHLEVVVISRPLLLPCTQQTYLQSPDAVPGGKTWYWVRISVRLAAFDF